MDDVVYKSNNPGELRLKIERAKKGLFDQEAEEDEDDEEWDDE
jgi:twitching motility protein PilT